MQAKKWVTDPLALGLVPEVVADVAGLDLLGQEVPRGVDGTQQGGVGLDPGSSHHSARLCPIPTRVVSPGQEIPRSAGGPTAWLAVTGQDGAMTHQRPEDRRSA